MKMKLKLKITLLFAALVLTAFMPAGAQIYGIDKVGLNSTYTFSYDVDLIIQSPSWAVSPSGYQILSTWSSSTRYFATVKWTTTGTKTLSFSDINGVRATKTVTVSSCSGTITAPVATDGSRCGTGTVQLTVNAAPAGQAVRWYETALPDLPVPGATTSTYTTPSLSATTAHTVAFYKTTTGCESAKTPITAYVYTQPSVNAGSDKIGSETCGLTSVSLSGSTPGSGNNGQWSIVSGSGGSFATASSPTSGFTGTSGNAYVLRWTVSNSACSANDDVNVTLNTIPQASASGQGLFTGYATAISLTSSVANTTFNWTASATNVSGASNGSGATIAQTLTTGSGNGTVTYTITPSTTYCTGTPVNAVATVYGKPVITASGNRIALNKPVSMSAATGYDSYTWKKETTVTGSLRTYSATGQGSYTVEVTKTGVTGTGISDVWVIKDQLTDLDENYVITTTTLESGFRYSYPVKPISTATVATASEKIDYLDGLGRPAQSVVTQGSPDKMDVVSFTSYDQFGRETKKYLPYAAAQDHGFYITSPVTGQQQFYQQGGSIPVDTRPYSETVFDNSPLNRPSKAYGAGEAWKNATTDRFVKTDFAFNDHAVEKIIAWSLNGSGMPVRSTVSNTSVAAGYYTTGQLYLTITTDEENHAVKEYKTRDGKVILKKVQAVSLPEADNAQHWAQTYYIYDKSGSLTYVFQPELSAPLAASTTLNPTTDDLDKFAFQYRYDDQNRMVEKKVPGSGWVYMILDSRDRVVLTQDANQRQTGEWTFTKYDVLNRPVATGKYVNVKSRTDMQTEVNTFYLNTANPMAETYIGTGTGNVMGYDNKSFPLVSNANDYYTFTYYDKYDATIEPSGYGYDGGALARLPATRNTRVQGQITATLVKNLGTGAWLRTVNHYDDKYRVVQAVSDHQRGKVRISNDYDFVGKLSSTKKVYIVDGVTRTILETFSYDHAGRLLTIKHSIDGAADVILVRNKYNDLSQLIEKDLHSTDDGSIFKQYVDYTYNIRGWTTKINDADISTTATGDGAKDYFGMKLSYQDAVSGFTSTPTFNGNISAIQWSKGNGTANRQSYSYTYDVMNRLIDATHYDYMNLSWTGNGNQYQEALTYDMNSNIKALQRRGLAGILMDNLEYGYTGNQLLYVHDTGDAANGFVNGNTGTDDYSYDSNGNMDKDKNKGLLNKGDIAYNVMNLPKEVKKGNEKIIYHYDATGRKLRQEVFNGLTLTKSTDYIGELVYENDELQFINTAEGRYVPIGNQYQYHLRDHLGNVHLTFTASPQTEDAIATLETANLIDEQLQFLRIENAKRVYSPIFDHTNGSGDGYAQRLSGGTNEKYGVAKSIAVMPGDTISMEVYAKYVDPNTSNWTPAFTTLMSAISSGSATVVFEGTSYSTSTASFSYAGQINPTNGAGAPKAYLNWLVFDKNFQFLTGGYKPVTTVAKENGQNVGHELLSSEIVISEPGFVYVYLSNEDAGGTPYDVYFDDLSVEHKQSAIVQMDDYYPFGLTYGSHYLDTPLMQSHLYNGKEIQDELDLEWMDFGARMYSPEMGRWSVIDPKAEEYIGYSSYAYVNNSPVLFLDPNGKEIWIMYGDDQKVQYRNGKLYNADGSKYAGKDRFVKAVTKQLNLINSIAIGKTVVGELSSSKNAFNFTNTFATGKNGAEINDALSFSGAGDGKGGEIHAGAMMTGKLGESQLVESAAHELFHGYQQEKGENDKQTTNREVGAFLFGRAVALTLGNGVVGFGNNSKEGQIYETAMQKLLFDSTFDQAAYDTAVKNFVKGSAANTASNGIYNSFKMKSGDKNPVIKKFFPLVRF